MNGDVMISILGEKINIERIHVPAKGGWKVEYDREPRNIRLDERIIEAIKREFKRTQK
jgi:hypothetical protein